MTTEEIAELSSLLKKLPEEDLLSPKMPMDVWKALHKVVPLPAVEVIISTTGKNFLLTHRKDEDWNGWHIPGGYILYKESIPAACNRIAQKELGIDVSFEKCIDAFAWPDHPFGSTISIVCVCSPKGDPKEGEYFTEIPNEMVPHHPAFLRTFLALNQNSH